MEQRRALRCSIHLPIRISVRISELRTKPVTYLVRNRQKAIRLFQCISRSRTRCECRTSVGTRLWNLIAQLVRVGVGALLTQCQWLGGNVTSGILRQSRLFGFRRIEFLGQDEIACQATACYRSVCGLADVWGWSARLADERPASTLLWQRGARSARTASGGTRGRCNAACSRTRRTSIMCFGVAHFFAS